MLNRNARYQEWLLPYLEGGLDEAQTALLEARLAADPALAAEAERLHRMVGGLRASASRTAPLESAQVPADLWPHLRARLVLDPAPAPRPRAHLWWVAGVGAPAAAALFVAAFWLPGWHAPGGRLSHQQAAPAKAAPPTPVPSLAPFSAGGGYPGASAKRSVAKPTAAAPKPAQAAPIAAAKTNPFALPAPIAPAVPPRVVRATSGPVGLSSGPSLGAGQAVRISGQVTAPVPGPAPSPVPPPAPMVASPVMPEPLPPAPSPAPVAAASADEAAPATKAVPNAAVNDLNGATPPQAKPHPANPMEMHAPSAQALHSTRRSKASLHYLLPPAGSAALPFATNGAADLDDSQAALSAAVQSPLWGENAGEQQANQALMAAREAGQLDDLRAHLEAQRSQAPRSLVTGRMLAAVYAFGFSSEPALRERRRIVGLEGATGEDWFALAQAEEAARNTASARAAYRHALESPVPPSAFHVGVARGK